MGRFLGQLCLATQPRGEAVALQFFGPSVYAYTVWQSIKNLHANTAGVGEGLQQVDSHSYYIASAVNCACADQELF